MAEQIIVSPERLQAISKQLATRAEIHQQNLTVLRSELSSLLGRWKGDAADAHSSEMEQMVFPAFQRLIDTLNHGAQVIQTTMQNFNEAQVEGEKPLRQLAETVPAEYKAAAQKGAGAGSAGQTQTGSVGAPAGSSGGSDGGASGGGGPQGGGSSGGGNPAAGSGSAKGAGTGAHGTAVSSGSGGGDAKGAGMSGGAAAAPADGGQGVVKATGAVVAGVSTYIAKQLNDKRKK